MLRILAALLTVGLAAASGPTQAQDFPTKPIKIVVPFGPGSGTDTATRLLGERLGAVLGQNIVVENRPGANGAIAAQAVKTAPADGYTLLMGTNSTHGANPGLMKDLPYDPIKDFVPVTLVGIFNSVLVVHPSVPAKTVAELIALGKGGTASLSFAAGNTSSLIMGEMFKRQAGFEARKVPYSSNPQGLTDVVAGRVSLMFPDIASAIGQVKDGTVRALAVVSLGERSTRAPELPTMAEAGLPGFTFVGWIGLFAPANTPRPVVARIARDTAAILTTTDFKQKLEQFGADAQAMDPDRFTAFVGEEVVRLPRILKEIGVEPL